MAQSKFFSGKLCNRMVDDLHLGRMSERTHAGYLRAVRQLADYCQTPPAKIAEDQLRRYFLYLKNEKKFAYGSLRVAFPASSSSTLGPATQRRLGYFVVSGGGVKVDDQGQASGWQATPKNFLFHHGTLGNVYKAKLADHLRSCGLYDAVPAQAWNKKFVVDIEPVGDGRAVLKYLAPYVHRVAISDNRIVACDEFSVTFRYKPSKAKTYRTRTVAGTEFVRGFAQHTLPRGFQKIRHYGWMSSNSKVSLDEGKWLVWLFLGWTFWLASGHALQEPLSDPSVLRCAECGGAMRVVDITFEPSGLLSEHALAYLDSG